jgi:uncharacterized membrane protein YcaP (DUF421 family)
MGGLVGAAALLGINHVVHRVRYAHPRWARRREGQPIVLVRDGHVLPPELKRLVVNQDELTQELRRQGASTLADVKECVLDQAGHITVRLRKLATDAGAIATALEHVCTQLARLTAQQQGLQEARADACPLTTAGPSTAAVGTPTRPSPPPPMPGLRPAARAAAGSPLTR